jgi:hypothetical protein
MDKTIGNMPTTCIQLGFSSEINNQLNTAPKTGMMNFHLFRSETFRPGR